MNDIVIWIAGILIALSIAKLILDMACAAYFKYKLRYHRQVLESMKEGHSNGNS
jgi:hypothetical protein